MPESSSPPVRPVASRASGPRLARRRVVQLLAGITGLSAIAVIAACQKAPAASPGARLLAGTLESLPVGSGTVLDAGSGPAIVVNTAEGVKAYSAICTHASCVVAWDDKAEQISCPCHEAFFDPLTGAVISGPPPAPLPPRTAVVEGQNIYVVAT